MKSRLIFKLLAVQLAVIGFVIGIVWVSIDTLAAGYFVTLMEKYGISPEPAHGMFVSAVHRYLLWASLAAFLLSVVLSFLMMRRILTPLMRMTGITREIAAGNFAVRVPAAGSDEVGELAQAFNRMAESLQKIEDLRRSLMIDVAHELRTPLTNIRGYLEALGDKVIPPNAKTFDLLQKETLRLAQLVEDVLNLARADAAHGELRRESVDLKKMISKAIRAFSTSFYRKSIRVSIRAPKRPVQVPIDKVRMVRVFRNLTDNAARYAPQGGTLSVRIQSVADRVRIVFDNEAKDLIEADLPFLFERFYRGEKSRSREHGGAGIGLAIVKAIVEAHGGTVGAALIDGRLRITLSLPLGNLANL